MLEIWGIQSTPSLPPLQDLNFSNVPGKFKNFFDYINDFPQGNDYTGPQKKSYQENIVTF